MRRLWLPTILLVATVAQAVDITTCGQTIPAAEVGTLQADLVCPNPNSLDDCLRSVGPPFGVEMEQRATLQLNGHTITGGCFGVSARPGRFPRLTIEGPGLVTGAFFGVYFNGRLTISDVSVDGNGAGIVSGHFSNNRSRVIATNVSASGNTGLIEGSGIVAPKIDATSVTVNGNANAGLTADRRLRATAVIANDNSYGAYTHNTASIDGFTATNSTYYGIVARRLQLSNATVTGSQSGIDLWTWFRPTTSNVTCDKSGSQFNPSMPWGVCTND